MNRVQRFSAVAASAAVILGTATACSSEVEKHLSYNHQEFGYISLTEVYGDEWDEFAVQCPGSNTDEIRDELGLEESKVKDNSTSENTEYVYLRNGEGDIKVEELEADRITLCPEPDHEEPEEFTGFEGWQPAETKFHTFRPDPKAGWRVIVDPAEELESPATSSAPEPSS